MNLRDPQIQEMLERRIARRRFVALATLAALAVTLACTSVISQASSLATGVLRNPHVLPTASEPGLAENHVAHQRRPAEVAGRYAVGRPPAAHPTPFPAGPAGGKQPVAPEPSTAAVAPAAPSAPTSVPTPAAPVEEPSAPPVEPEPTPPPKTEPEPPPKTEPEPPAEPEPTPPPPEKEPEPPAVDPAEPVDPEPEPPPSTPAEAPIFEGTEIGDFEEIQSAPMAITEVLDPLGSGEHVFKMTVDNDDVAPVTPTENPRAQALSPDVVEAGDEFWLTTKFMIPTNYPAVTGWLSLLSVYGAPYFGSSPWSIGVEGSKLSWMRNSTYHYDVPWEEPLRKGVWITVLTHERFATDGWVEMWIDGNQVTFFSGKPAATQKLEMQTMDRSNNGGGNSVRIAQYREADMFETGTLYFGAVKLGESRESVAG
jgi:hypothetical protein